MTDLKQNQAIWLVLSEVPEGKVVTYGQVAEMAGITNGARIVGTVLSQLPPASHLPWHRVINSKGEISFPESSPRYCTQRERLEQEGITFFNHKVRLKDYRWDGVPV